MYSTTSVGAIGRYTIKSEVIHDKKKLEIKKDFLNCFQASEKITTEHEKSNSGDECNSLELSELSLSDLDLSDLDLLSPSNALCLEFVKLNALNQINSLKSYLTPCAKLFFSNLLNVAKCHFHKDFDTIVLGDSDGSLPRMILIALQAGYVSLSTAQLKTLAQLLNVEARWVGVRDSVDLNVLQKAHWSVFKKYSEEYAISNYDNICYSYLQQSEFLGLLLNQLANEITYQKGFVKLIYCGDIIHDRLSTNKKALITFIEKLNLYKAVFILGNHDSHISLTRYDAKLKVLTSSSYQFGSNAYDGGFQADSEAELREIYNNFEKSNFLRCYFDKENSIFYIHNGIVIDNNYIFTAFESHYEAVKNYTEFQSVEELEDYINQIPISSLNKTHMTNFRPNAKKTRATLKQSKIFDGVTIVQGHTGCMSANENLVVLNSRAADVHGSSWPKPAAMQLGKVIAAD